jgi:hypothetical protein
MSESALKRLRREIREKKVERKVEAFRKNKLRKKKRNMFE